MVLGFDRRAARQVWGTAHVLTLTTRSLRLALLGVVLLLAQLLLLAVRLRHLASLGRELLILGGLVVLTPSEGLVVGPWAVFVESTLTTESVDLTTHVVPHQFAGVVTTKLFAEKLLTHSLVPLLVAVLGTQLFQLPVFWVGVDRSWCVLIDLLLHLRLGGHVEVLREVKLAPFEDLDVLLVDHGGGCRSTLLVSEGGFVVLRRFLHPRHCPLESLDLCIIISLLVLGLLCSLLRHLLDRLMGVCLGPLLGTSLLGCGLLSLWCGFLRFGGSGLLRGGCFLWGFL